MSVKSEDLLGNWVYRSLRNNKNIDTAFNDLRFGAGIIEFNNISDNRILDSTLNMGGDYALTLEGEINAQNGEIQSINWRGSGVQDTPTAGWIYDYKAFIAPTWEEAPDKTIVLVGTVLRTVPHGGAPAGVTGTFYMVKMS
ncbi:MAG TPA: hypothetical protein VK400_14095 [Pyrinomonadaceae bacterium]|nr:hypothetical protein [Pyrinomonadaceae bacterium]